MILFDLQCDSRHRFEAWFQSSTAFEDQQARGLVTCPDCGSDSVAKAVMAPAVPAKGNRQPDARAARLAALRAEVEATCDYVGRDFASAARARAEGLATGSEPRGIYGEATLSDAVELLSEGIAVAPLPFRPRRLSDA